MLAALIVRAMASAEGKTARRRERKAGASNDSSVACEGGSRAEGQVRGEKRAEEEG